MKIIEFRAERFKRLSAVEITPEGNTVIISGRNGQGKSSVLDAIWLALGGGNAVKDSATTVPIKDGETNAVVRLDLGDIIVTRKWTANGSTLTVEGADGRKYNSPQTLLDTLVGAISFDPLSFSKMSAAEQRMQLLSLTNLPIDPDKLDADRRELYDKRTIVNRDIKVLQAELSGTPYTEGVGDEEASISDIAKRISVEQEQLNKIQSFRRCLDEDREKAESLRAEIAQKTKELYELVEKITKAEALSSAFVEPNIEKTQADLENAEQRNRLVRQNKKHNELKLKAKAKTAESDALTQQIEAIDKTKKDAFLNAKFPVPGLSVDDDGVLYNGIPFRQCSSAEQLKICVAIASALNPKIRVIRVADASLLDSESLNAIATIADEQDIQIWLERVTDGKEKVGVVIEDGAVKS